MVEGNLGEGYFMKKKMKIGVTWFLVVWFPMVCAGSAFGWDDPLGWEESSDDTTSDTGETITDPASLFDTENSDDEVDDNEIPWEDDPLKSLTGSGNNAESGAQNAVVEGIQLTSDTTEVADEKIITGYFIFRDKPTSYFYEIKPREKKLIFEFNDTEMGNSPVPSVAEDPILGFTLEQKKVDINKDVKGLRPEWHDQIRVTFDLKAVPEIRVVDEYSIITFNFKWTNNPSKIKEYAAKDKSPAVILWSTAGLTGVGLGALGYYLFLREPPEPPGSQPLSIEDLPTRPDL
jgi:hypothetical protein